MPSLISNLCWVLTLAVACSAGFANNIYIIRNAEAGISSLSSSPLSAAGISRAFQCLPSLYGSTESDIGLILSDNTDAALLTAQPLADQLGIDVDASCQGGNDTAPTCIKDVISNYITECMNSVLVIWDETNFDDIEKAFGLRNFPKHDPDSVYILRGDIFVAQATLNCASVVASGDSGSSPDIDNTPSTSTSDDEDDDNEDDDNEDDDNEDDDDDGDDDDSSDSDDLPPTAGGNVDGPVPTPSITISPPSDGTANPFDLFYTTTVYIPDPTPAPTAQSNSDSNAGIFETRERRSGMVRKRAFRRRRSCPNFQTQV